MTEKKIPQPPLTMFGVAISERDSKRLRELAGATGEVARTATDAASAMLRFARTLRGECPACGAPEGSHVPGCSEDEQ